MSEKININGPINFIKLNNNNYEINIFIDIFEYNIQKCDNIYENIDIDKYLILLFKNTKNNYNFFIINSNNYEETKQYNYIDRVFKIENSAYLFKNIKFINFQFNHFNNFINFNNFNIFINYYYNLFYFDRKTIYILSDKLKSIIVDCEKILLFDYNTLLKTIKSKTNKIILNNILKNYFINKIKLLINDCNFLIKYINEHIQLLKYIYTNDKYYEILKNIYKLKESICENLIYIMNFLDIYNIIIKILEQKTEKNIIHLSLNHSCILIWIIINYFNFKIVYKNYSDKIIDNGLLLGINKIFKNINIINISSIIFLENYLNNNSTHCIQIEKNLLE
jgi:hypothetical protein